MGFCQKFKVPQVICDEIFYITDVRTFDAGQDIEVGATATGTVDVTVTECDIAVVDNAITANVELTVQKEITVNQVNPFDLEFMYTIDQTVTFQGCTAEDIPDDVSPDALECQVVRLEFDEDIVLDPDADTVTDTLVILLKLKVDALRQVFLSLCPANLQATAVINNNGA